MPRGCRGPDERVGGGPPRDERLLSPLLPTFDRAGVARVQAACPGATLAIVSSLAVQQVAELVEDDGIDVVLSKREPPEAMVRALLARLGA
jgi:hypothetical protein